MKIHLPNALMPPVVMPTHAQALHVGMPRTDQSVFPVGYGDAVTSYCPYAGYASPPTYNYMAAKKARTADYTSYPPRLKNFYQRPSALLDYNQQPTWYARARVSTHRTRAHKDTHAQSRAHVLVVSSNILIHQRRGEIVERNDIETIHCLQRSTSVVVFVNILRTSYCTCSHHTHYLHCRVMLFCKL